MPTAVPIACDALEPALPWSTPDAPFEGAAPLSRGSDEVIVT